MDDGSGGAVADVASVLLVVVVVVAAGNHAMNLRSSIELMVLPINQD